MLRRVLPLAMLAVLALAGCSSLSDVVNPAAPTAEPAPYATGEIDSSVTCTDTERIPVDMTNAVWTHPSNSFFEGTEERIPSEQDLEHILLNDSAVIVIYDPAALNTAQLSPLREWIEQEVAAVAIPTADEPLAPIELRMGDVVKLCDGVDVVRFAQLAMERVFTTGVPHETSSEAEEAAQQNVPE